MNKWKWENPNIRQMCLYFVLVISIVSNVIVSDAVAQGAMPEFSEKLGVTSARTEGNVLIVYLTQLCR